MQKLSSLLLMLFFHDDVDNDNVITVTAGANLSIVGVVDAAVVLHLQTGFYTNCTLAFQNNRKY